MVLLPKPYSTREVEVVVDGKNATRKFGSERDFALSISCQMTAVEIRTYLLAD